MRGEVGGGVRGPIPGGEIGAIVLGEVRAQAQLQQCFSSCDVGLLFSWSAAEGLPPRRDAALVGVAVCRRHVFRPCQGG